MQINEKVVVITGGASGLGQRTVEYMVQEKGARVAVFDLNQVAGEALAERLGRERVLYCQVDVADEQAVSTAVARTLAYFGAIDVCINCAGIPTPMKILDREGQASNCERFAQTVRVNLNGSFNVMSHCVAAMARNTPDADGERGVVINTASGAAFDGRVGHSAYSASKAGVVGLSLPAARELSGLGIRVNAIAPGLFDTPMGASLSPHVLAAMVASIEFPKRFGDMAEFAFLCAHICENRYINGECIRLDAATRLTAR